MHSPLHLSLPSLLFLTLAFPSEPARWFRSDNTPVVITIDNLYLSHDFVRKLHTAQPLFRDLHDQTYLTTGAVVKYSPYDPRQVIEKTLEFEMNGQECEISCDMVHGGFHARASFPLAFMCDSAEDEDGSGPVLCEMQYDGAEYVLQDARKRKEQSKPGATEILENSQKVASVSPVRAGIFGTGAITGWNFKCVPTPRTLMHIAYAIGNIMCPRMKPLEHGLGWSWRGRRP